MFIRRLFCIRSAAVSVGVGGSLGPPGMEGAPGDAELDDSLTVARRSNSAMRALTFGSGSLRLPLGGGCRARGPTSDGFLMSPGSGEVMLVGDETMGIGVLPNSPTVSSISESRLTEDIDPSEGYIEWWLGVPARCTR